MKISTVSQECLSAKKLLKLLSLFFLFLCIEQSPAYAGGKKQGGNNNIEPEKNTDLGFLPIVMTPLKGYCSQGTSYMSWNSLQESNSSHFDIQRSSDGVDFYNVGKVLAHTTSDKVVEYSFNDSKANEGINYYRLKYYDNDGQFQYSNTIVLNVRIKGINITAVYPGPFVDRVNVNIASEVKTTASVNLFDNTGKMLISRQSILNKGVTTLTVDKLENLAKGIYIIKIQAGDTIETQKLIK